MSDGSDPPEAMIVPRSRFLPELIWAIPIVAALIGGWLAVRAIRAHGPTITVSFRDAAGLVAGKTKLKYRDVEVGEVRDIGFSPDRATVVITAELVREAEPWMVDDTRFWVARARVAVGEVTGLETLLSGAYIGLDVGSSRRERRDFVGLEEVPIISGGTPGKAFVARGARAIGAGSPIFFHHLQVGQVTTSELDADGRQVSVGMFVRAPFDRYVTTGTRFWEAGGIRATLDTAGVKVDVESLVTLLVGGISFEPGPAAGDASPAPTGHRFVLFRSRDDAMKQPDTESEDYTVVFHQTVRGLAIGAPVEFRGIALGEVTGIGLDYDPATLEFAHTGRGSDLPGPPARPFATWLARREAGVGPGPAAATRGSGFAGPAAQREPPHRTEVRGAGLLPGRPARQARSRPAPGRDPGAAQRRRGPADLPGRGGPHGGTVAVERGRAPHRRGPPGAGQGGQRAFGR